jgi:type IV pilus assembly protein PilY1
MTTLNRLFTCTVVGTALATGSFAAQTDIAPAPLIVSSPQSVLPNLMFVLDDSGSMGWNYMPDEADNFEGRYGFATAQCNGVYYNPAITYRPPVDAAGVSLGDSSFTGAWVNGFNRGAGTVDLRSQFRAYNENSDATATRAFYYTYSGTQTAEALKKYADSSSLFYRECNSSPGGTSEDGDSVFTRVDISDTSTERTNFANWFSYYRTRMLAMKSATGRAFSTVDDTYRVGYMSINNSAGSSFLNLATFDSTQKTAWYAKLYGASANGWTPLREALSNSGRVYAGKLTSLHGVSVNDPIQYSCQKNFTLLSTDGYWNGNAGFKVDGSTAVGNQDSNDPRPYNDGGSESNIYQATLTVSGDSNTTISSIKVGGVEILSASASSGKKDRINGLALAITTNINACTATATGNCGASGYRAVRTGGTVTITAPAMTTVTPVLTRSTGTMSVAATAFAGATVTVAGTSDTLADVASYYHDTDLRSSALGNASNGTTDVSANNVPPGGGDDATWQHMTTFTLGLGARGQMVFSPTYKIDTTGDFFAVKSGATASSSTCTWQATGTTCNWPIPASNSRNNIDDLWHAAVNGRGTYFSATDPASLAVGLRSALQAINAIRSTAATATTSSPIVTSTDNARFISTFESGYWAGQLERFTIDLDTGEESGTPSWQAQQLLDARSHTARTIYTYSALATNKLKPFTWAELTADEKSKFQNAYISSASAEAGKLTQYCDAGEICMDDSLRSSDLGERLVNFVRGDRSNEGFSASEPFRQRVSVLGDIVNGRPLYVPPPRRLYVDDGYAAFANDTTVKARKKMVYAAANDGMLHAFDADTGEELWAYVPSMLMGKLYKLADKYYDNHHQYYVDGSPVEADVKFADGTWRTVVVGGLNRGGRGYYALDVTDPANPKALWEFTHANMGYTFGRPEIGKLANGQWAAFVTSGYNNTDGKGYLYVVNVENGNLIRSIGTGTGDASNPSGLAQVRGWVEVGAYDNTVLRVYGGDLLGNVWRFDVNDNVAPSGYEAHKLVTLSGPTGDAQPVTTKPELGKVRGHAVVFAGTGRSLGTSDLNDSSTQSLYAIKDSLGTTTLANPRGTGSSFVKQTLTNSTCTAAQETAGYCVLNAPVRTGSGNAVNFASDNGWYIDLPATREKIDTDSQLAFGVLAFSTNAYDSTACSVGGSSYSNFLNYATGAPVKSAQNLASVGFSAKLSTGASLVVLTKKDPTTGAVTKKLVSTTCKSDGTCETMAVPPPEAAVTPRRTSWRELPTE